MTGPLCFSHNPQSPCQRACGKCRVRLRRIREAHENVTDAEFERLIQQAVETGTPLTRGAIRAFALRKRNEPPQGIGNTWPMLSVRIPPETMEHLQHVAETTGHSLATVVRALCAP